MAKVPSKFKNEFERKCGDPDCDQCYTDDQVEDLRTIVPPWLRTMLESLSGKQKNELWAWLDGDRMAPTAMIETVGREDGSDWPEDEPSGYRIGDRPEGQVRIYVQAPPEAWAQVAEWVSKITSDGSLETYLTSVVSDSVAELANWHADKVEVNVDIPTGLIVNESV